jgi:antitoxin (DNA-binding transcriptional repressor) of toxin-antitoxin stability system
MVDGAFARGERYTITRYGRAVAALVGVEDLRRIEAADEERPRPGGALALAGLWGDVTDAEIDAFLDEVLVTRDRDSGRWVERQV